MGAKANRAYVATTKEAAWGVTPATPPMQKLNFVTDSLNYALETTTPDSIRDDRQVSDVINVSAGNEGGYEFEMQAVASGPEDYHLLAALWAEDWVGGPTAKGSLEGAVLTASGATIDFTTPGDPSLIVGQKVILVGSLLGNDGVYTVVDIASAPVYGFDGPFSADETWAAGTNIYNGEYAKNGLFEHSFTLERGHEDVGEYFVYTGMVCNEFTLNIEAGAVVTGGYTFVGKDAAVTQAELVGGVYTDAPITPYMSAGFNVKNVLINGAPIEACLLQSLEININNNVSGKLAVGEFGYCDTSEGEFEVTGAINLYFNDSTMYQRFLDSEAFSLSWQMQDNDGNYYIFTLPRLKLATDAVNVEGKNTDVMDAAEYVALIDETEGCTLRIDRFIIAGL